MNKRGPAQLCTDTIELKTRQGVVQRLLMKGIPVMDIYEDGTEEYYSEVFQEWVSDFTHDVSSVEDYRLSENSRIFQDMIYQEAHATHKNKVEVHRYLPAFFQRLKKFWRQELQGVDLNIRKDIVSAYFSDPLSYPHMRAMMRDYNIERVEYDVSFMDHEERDGELFLYVKKDKVVPLNSINNIYRYYQTPLTRIHGLI